ncbi:hypothetical protein N7524_009611 [Penicillium chrysogenum]|nr:hypothetical protein N7524_009611 [Penicillium chrysogenum]
MTGVLENSKPTEGATADKNGTNVTFNEQTNYVPKSTIITIFLACSSVDLLALMDQTTLAASLSIIGNALGASDQTSWISGGYFVTSTCFQLLYGKLSDIWSRKLVLFVGLAIFFVGSLAASLAQTATQLIVFRAFTGVGGGGLMTVAQMIVSDVVPLRERGKYQGILGAVVAIANGIGPVIGGALASISEDSWRWIFRLNLPLTALTTLAVLFFMPLRKVTGDWKVKLKAIDFFGALLALGGTSVLLLGLTWGGGEYEWNSAHVIATLIAGFATSVAFVVWQWKGASTPLVPMHIFQGRIVNGACLTMFINGWNLFGASLLYSHFLSAGIWVFDGKSGCNASSHYPHAKYESSSCRPCCCANFLTAISSTGSGLVVHWVGRYRECILFGWIIWAVGLGLFSTLDQHSGLGKQIGYGILTGVGVGNTLQPSLIAVQAGVERRDMAVITSFRNFVRNLGGTLGLAIAGTIINNIVSSSISVLNLDESQSRSLLSSPQNYLSKLSAKDAEHVRDVLTPAYQKGFRIIFIVGASLATFAFFLAVWLMPQVGLNRVDDQALKEEAKKRLNGELDEEKRGS